MSEGPVVHVAIALVWRDRRLLVARRQQGAHLAGFWEFPGGKLEPGETPELCAEREVLEETGVICRARARRDCIRHDYPDRTLRIQPIDCDWLSGEPAPHQASELAWVPVRELVGFEFPPANASLLEELARS